METKYDKPRTPAEVISRAMAIWGPDGEHWCRYRLKKGDSYCLVGALSKAAYGKHSYAHLNGYKLHPKAKRTALSRAYAFVEKYIPSHIAMTQVNDNSSFKEVKSLMCSALKDALAEEEVGGRV